MPRLFSHPLAQPKREDARPPSMGEATVMILASEDLFRGIREVRRQELETWLRSETRPERLRLIAAMLDCRSAMRAP